MTTRTQTKPLERRETSSLIGSDKVEGTPVYRSNGDTVGQIEESATTTDFDRKGDDYGNVDQTNDRRRNARHDRRSRRDKCCGTRSLC
jgi:hypothetical protein